MTSSEAITELEEEFQRVVKQVQELPKEGPYQSSNEEKLTFYGLFKQATEGPCNTTRPGFLDFVGKAKWDAWSALGAMSKEEAKRRYIEEYKRVEVKARAAEEGK